MTGAERSWASRYEINDVVRYARGSKSAGIEAGEYGTVVGINSAANLLTVERSTGELANYDPRRLTGVSVYREVAHDFSVGDRIQFTAPDKSLGVANRDLAVIESIAPDGHISARLDNNRRIEFNASEHRHFDHGYAVTSHSSQGLTAERVLVNADTGVHPDLLNSRFGYVSISRASHEATLFTDDITKLNPQLSADVSKTSALEVDRTAIDQPEPRMISAFGYECFATEAASHKNCALPCEQRSTSSLQAGDGQLANRRVCRFAVGASNRLARYPQTRTKGFADLFARHPHWLKDAAKPTDSR